MRREERRPRAVGKRVLERLEEDRRSAPRALRPIFVDILRYLEDPTLRGEVLVERYRTYREELTELFEVSLGCSLEAYLRSRRLELAAELLEVTRLPVWQVGARSGWKSARAFRRAFKKEHGSSPEEWRRSKNSTGDQHRPRPEATTGREWRRLILGSLGIEKVEQWLDRLYGICPEKRSAGALARTSMSEDPGSEEVIAKAVVETLRALPESERLQVALSWAGRFETPALHDHLLQQSRQEGRRGQPDGVWMAELSLECLKPLAGRVEAKDLRRLTMRGLAWLANSRRQNGDPMGARNELEVAKALLSAVEAPADLRAEVAHLECHLLICERRYEEALLLAKEAVFWVRDLGNSELYAQTLLAQGAAAWYSDSIDLAVDSFEKAVLELAHGGDHYAKFVAHQNLALGYLKAGQLESAAEELETAKYLSNRLEAPARAQHLQWTHALICHRRGDLANAEKLYLVARKGLCKSKDHAHLAVISLDLAMLYTEMSRGAEARKVVEKTLPILKALRLTLDTLAAFKLLVEASQLEEVGLEILKQLRDRLAASCNAPPA